MRLHEEMQTLEILVELHAHSNKTHLNNSWCDDIELSLLTMVQNWRLHRVRLALDILQRTGAMHFEESFFTLCTTFFLNDKILRFLIISQLSFLMQIT